MKSPMPSVEQYLQDHQIHYIVHEHPAVYTCEEAQKHCADIPGLACKNLLLKNKKGDQYFLLILPAAKKADLKAIAQTVGGGSISFASAEALKEKLGLDPGSVSPFGLLNDTNHEVAVYVDEAVYNAAIVSFHPNRNTATLELTGDAFRTFLQTLEQEVHVVR